MRNRLLLIVLLGALFLAAHPTNVQACSGYPYFGVDDLPSMELLVSATVIDTDDRGFNAVIRVENYYKGEGAPFITVMRYPPALASGAYVRGYDTSCLYAGRGHRWRKGAFGYFGLLSNGDGTFTDNNWGTAHFYPINGEIYYEEGATEGYAMEFDDPLTISEDEFITRMLQAGNRTEPVAPETDDAIFYPLMRFLTVTTENGTRYQVNPDRSIHRLPSDGPLAISPDGAHLAFRADDETIAFQYIWTDYTYTEEFVRSRGREVFEEFMRPGKAVRFSGDSNFAVVWNEAELTVYMIGNRGPTYMDGYGYGLTITEVAQVDFAETDHALLPQVMWSPDGSTLVWEDSSGVWRWDIYDDSEPTQLVAAGEMEGEAQFDSLLDVSTFGRFVRVGRANDWTLIDAESGVTHANAFAAPTEQFLVFIADEATEDSATGDAMLSSSCTPPLRDTCVVLLENEHLGGIFPYQSNLVGYIECDPEADGRCYLQSRSWHPAISSYVGYSGGRYIGAYIGDLRQISYDPQYDQPVLLVGDYQLYFNFYSDHTVESEDYRPYLDILELEGAVDSPITTIEWGQPVFFDEYRLTTSAYLPR